LLVREVSLLVADNCLMEALVSQLEAVNARMPFEVVEAVTMAGKAAAFRTWLTGVVNGIIAMVHPDDPESKLKGLQQVRESLLPGALVFEDACAFKFPVTSVT
jgi:hypothetical protein